MNDLLKSIDDKLLQELVDYLAMQEEGKKDGTVKSA